MKFSENLKALRKGKGLTQKALGEQVGLSTSTIQAYELGVRFPALKQLQTLARFFHVSLDQISDDKDMFILEAQEQYGAQGRRDAKALIGELGTMFAGGEVPEDDMDDLFQAFSEVYFDAKKRNKKYGRKAVKSSNP